MIKRFALTLVVALSLSISFAEGSENSCAAELLPSTDGRPRYPIFEFPRNVVGTVNVRFVVLNNGTTSEIEIISSSSVIFEYAAKTYLESSRFPKRKTPCNHQLSIKLEMKNRLWSVDASPT